MRMFSLLTAVLLALCLVPCASAEETDPLYDVFTYGYSVQGRELQCHRIGDPEAGNSFLWVFAVHGFEDSFKQDGKVLTRIAELMIEHYRTNMDALNNYVLYIVPAANPDGQQEGRSKDGFGRCNADGLDINRDFPVGWKKMTTARYKTGSEPFSTPEARYLRDLAQQIMPTYGADVHGWINRVYGTPDLAQPFMDAFGFRYKEYKSGGMLSQWLAEFTEGALLIELPDRAGKEGFAEDCAAKLIAGLDAWIAQTALD